MEETIPHWKQQQLEAEQKKFLKQWYPEIGKIVSFSGEVGVVVFSPGWKVEDEDPEYFKYKPGEFYTEAYSVRWDTKSDFDYEEYAEGTFDYKTLDSYEFKYINPDGTRKH